MDRRVFLAGLGAVLALPAQAQQVDKPYRIGFLAVYPYTPERSSFATVLVPAMRDLGYIEGRNLQITVRSANNHVERLPALAAELVRLSVDVIITGGDSEVRAAKQATSTIPIVMVPSGDTVRAGYVASYARPGGNVTGFAWVSADLSAKLLQILKDAVPNVSRLAVLWDAANPVKVLDFEETRRAVSALGLTLSSIELTAASDLNTALAATRRARPDALMILTDEMLNYTMYTQIVDFTMQQRLPSILGEPTYAAAGGFIAYGPSGRQMWRRAAIYVDKILKGAKPGDLPIERPTTFELVINLKTAKALGLTIPPSLIQRADQIIQ